MGQFITGEAARERFRALFDQVDAVFDEMRALSSDAVGNEFRVEMAERLEAQERVNRGLMYRIFGEIADPPDDVGMLPTVIDSLGARLRIARNEVKRRLKVSGRIRPRRQLAGPPLPPELPVVAQAVESGVIGEDHLRAICRAMEVLPSCVSEVDRGDVEVSLVREASKNDAEFVRVVGRRIDEIFNPDGHFDETDRARRRGLLLGAQVLTGCRGCRVGSIRRPAAMWRRSPRPCVRAATCPTAPWPRCVMSAALPNAAMTASNWVSRRESAPKRWAGTAVMR